MVKSRSIFDRELLDDLEKHNAIPLSVDVWRTSWHSRDPLIGSTAGGRWHPQNSFEALYTSLDKDGSLAEIYYHLSKAPVFSSSQMLLHRLKLKTRRTLELIDIDILNGLGIDEKMLSTADYGRCQEIGSAAHFLEYDSLIVPSSRWSCNNLVLFSDRLNADEAISIEDTTDINWPAWKEKIKRS